MLSAELRSPHQRRSDHLSILTRRAPPPPTPARFSKTVTDAASVCIFDPAFDSDADTDGPASGSSLWRRDFSRVVSAASASAAAAAHAAPDPLLPPPPPPPGPDPAVAQGEEEDDHDHDHDHHVDHGHDHDHLATPPNTCTTFHPTVPPQHPASAPAEAEAPPDHDMAHESPNPLRFDTHVTVLHIPPEHPRPTDDVQPMEGLTAPKRHSYPADRALSDEHTPPAGVTFCRDRARSFYGRVGRDLEDARPEGDDPHEEGDIGPMSNAQLRHVLDDDFDLFYREKMGPKGDDPDDDSPTKSASTAPDSPVMKDKGSDSDASRGRFVKKVRSFRLFSSDERLTVALVGEAEAGMEDEGGVGERGGMDAVNEDLDMTGRELNQLLAGTLQRPRLSSGRIPLFVEEAGRIPRAAIVDGRMQRVQVRRKRGRGKERQKSFVERVLARCLSKTFGEEGRRKGVRSSRGARRSGGRRRAGRSRRIW